jgi:predicted AlkP superfamily pyrophosphatase or phosphodiesterase
MRQRQLLQLRRAGELPRCRCERLRRVRRGLSHDAILNNRLKPVNDAIAAPEDQRVPTCEARGDAACAGVPFVYAEAVYPTAVIDLVGLTRAMLGPDTPHLDGLRRRGSAAPIRSGLPAVTCTAQATYMTGRLPREHGIVGNGWYFRDVAQVMFWRQPDQLVHGEKVWHAARRRDPAFTCAKMFWWFNMYGDVDWSVTPRPIYPADGRKIPELYSSPADLGSRLAAQLGAFPFFDFWGPRSGIKSSEWIAEASLKVDDWFAPSLLMIYLPHLDYDLQRFGASAARSRAQVPVIDALAGRLIDALRARGRRVLVLSEYGLTDVTRPVHLNRVLRDAGWLAVRDELGTDAFDPGASRAFAVADHQVAHVYVRHRQDVDAVTRLIAAVPGVETVLDAAGQAEHGLDHERSGELVAIAAPDAWFTYYYWTDDVRAPDYARTVDIHRKPGYDPAELFLDPRLTLPSVRVAATLARKALGFRYLMNVIPLDATLVRGSHGRIPASLDDGPMAISSESGALEGPLEPTAVHDLILSHLFDAVPHAS